MKYSYYTADVFSDRPFGGNPLAVFPRADGLTAELMQKIAREFNFSETVFVFPPETADGTRRARIFTPTTELPFAGHPTVGTAFVLVAIGEIPLENETRIYLEEGVGLVPVTIRGSAGKPVYSELTAAKLPEFGAGTPSIEDLAGVLSLDASDFLTGEYRPRSISCGVPFLFVPVRDRAVLSKIKLNLTVWEAVLARDPANSLFVFCLDPELPGSDIRARMFAPRLGVAEDPATGSAVAAFGGYLGAIEPLRDGTIERTIEQGFEMGRPSLLRVSIDKRDGEIVAIRVGGASVLVCQGVMEIPDP
ncbi:PhzF family phenazine biosynthesis protein [Pannus brasiliensis CCIBt3594]|uniref:PhzF family phenazine biosynthesis protein n=1 Tax=Pannus brasiliensis CCIBt3594 TaxID=1427578 RepID=A0AAW9QIJ0_9CHRO